ncbi:hypothetical protein TRFO_09812 [Tritrichomonas foetus]|uniref:Ubiquitin-like domain-containing protein n=1 Tax=Tritrichomonas foetus TaxID=1144522 RepID=A0A1J4JHB5_9EUKA|nr:hypothetical protein TRFO_09812 [Tritrichomonas foetus]|eukprot:OHS96660.1 hypothetical protein TRFO_09812 [Tritrichomonas foetus]
MNSSSDNTFYVFYKKEKIKIDACRFLGKKAYDLMKEISERFHLKINSFDIVRYDQNKKTLSCPINGDKTLRHLYNYYYKVVPYGEILTFINPFLNRTFPGKFKSKDTVSHVLEYLSKEFLTPSNKIALFVNQRPLPPNQKIVDLKINSKDLISIVFHSDISCYCVQNYYHNHPYYIYLTHPAIGSDLYGAFANLTNSNESTLILKDVTTKLPLSKSQQLTKEQTNFLFEYAKVQSKSCTKRYDVTFIINQIPYIMKILENSTFYQTSYEIGKFLQIPSTSLVFFKQNKSISKSELVQNYVKDSIQVSFRNVKLYFKIPNHEPSEIEQEFKYYSDVKEIKKIISKKFNISSNNIDLKFYDRIFSDNEKSGNLPNTKENPIIVEITNQSIYSLTFSMLDGSEKNERYFDGNITFDSICKTLYQDEETDTIQFYLYSNNTLINKTSKVRDYPIGTKIIVTQTLPRYEFFINNKIDNIKIDPSKTIQHIINNIENRYRIHSVRIFNKITNEELQPNRIWKTYRYSPINDKFYITSQPIYKFKFIYHQQDILITTTNDLISNLINEILSKYSNIFSKTKQIFIFHEGHILDSNDHLHSYNSTTFNISDYFKEKINLKLAFLQDQYSRTITFDLTLYKILEHIRTYISESLHISSSIINISILNKNLPLTTELITLKEEEDIILFNFNKSSPTVTFKLFNEEVITINTSSGDTLSKIKTRLHSTIHQKKYSKGSVIFTYFNIELPDNLIIHSNIPEGTFIEVRPKSDIICCTFNSHNQRFKFYFQKEEKIRNAIVLISDFFNIEEKFIKIQNSDFKDLSSSEKLDEKHNYNISFQQTKFVFQTDKSPLTYTFDVNETVEGAIQHISMQLGISDKELIIKSEDHPLTDKTQSLYQYKDHDLYIDIISHKSQKEESKTEKKHLTTFIFESTNGNLEIEMNELTTVKEAIQVLTPEIIDSKYIEQDFLELYYNNELLEENISLKGKTKLQIVHQWSITFDLPHRKNQYQTHFPDETLLSDIRTHLCSKFSFNPTDLKFYILFNQLESEITDDDMTLSELDERYIIIKDSTSIKSKSNSIKPKLSSIRPTIIPIREDNKKSSKSSESSESSKKPITKPFTTTSNVHNDKQQYEESSYLKDSINTKDETKQMTSFKFIFNDVTKEILLDQTSTLFDNLGIIQKEFEIDSEDQIQYSTELHSIEQQNQKDEYIDNFPLSDLIDQEIHIGIIRNLKDTLVQTQLKNDVKYIYQVSSDEPQEAFLNNQSTIRDLKKEISKTHDNISISNITVLFAGKSLGDQILLSRLDLDEDEIIQVYIKTEEELYLLTAKGLRVNLDDSDEYDDSYGYEYDE